MDAKAVEHRGRLIARAMTENQPSSELLKHLSELKTGVKVEEELLRKTKIGMTVNKLRTHKDPAVAKAAQELVKKWKDEVQKGPRSAAARAAANGASSPAPGSGTASPAPPKAQPKKHGVDPEKRNHKTDKINYEVTGNDTRDSCVRLMYDALALMTDELPEDVLAVAKAIEAAAFANNNSTPSDAYKTKIRSLFQNLKNKSNPDLRKRVLSGEIPPKKFVTLTHDELKSNERRKQDEEMEKENVRVARVSQAKQSISTEFTCGKCKKNKVYYSQAQTRSADEPMTTFCTCAYCGNRWKFS